MSAVRFRSLERTKHNPNVELIGPGHCKYCVCLTNSAGFPQQGASRGRPRTSAPERNRRFRRMISRSHACCAICPCSRAARETSLLTLVPARLYLLVGSYTWEWGGDPELIETFSAAQKSHVAHYLFRALTYFAGFGPVACRSGMILAPSIHTQKLLQRLQFQSSRRSISCEGQVPSCPQEIPAYVTIFSHPDHFMGPPKDRGNHKIALSRDAPPS